MATAAPVSTAKPVDTRGLANQVVGETKICAVTQTELIYRGYEIADLAENATFEEVAFLLLVGHKPSAAELSASSIAAYRKRGVDLILGGFLHFQEEIEYFGSRVLPLVREIEAAESDSIGAPLLASA